MIESPWSPAFADILERHLSRAGWDEPVTPDTDLEAAGIGSLETIALMVEIEDHFEIAFPESALTPEAFSSPARLWSALQLAAVTGGPGDESGPLAP